MAVLNWKVVIWLCKHGQKHRFVLGAYGTCCWKSPRTDFIDLQIFQINFHQSRVSSPSPNVYLTHVMSLNFVKNWKVRSAGPSSNAAGPRPCCCTKIGKIVRISLMLIFLKHDTFFLRVYETKFFGVCGIRTCFKTYCRACCASSWL